MLSSGSHGLNLEQRYMNSRAEGKTKDQDLQSSLDAAKKSMRKHLYMSDLIYKDKLEALFFKTIY